MSQHWENLYLQQQYGGCFFEIVIFSHSSSDFLVDHGGNLVVNVLKFTEWISVYI